MVLPSHTLIFGVSQDLHKPRPKTAVRSPPKATSVVRPPPEGVGMETLSSLGL